MEPATFEEGDLNGDGRVEVTDVVLAIKHLPDGMPAPVSAPGELECLEVIPMEDEDGPRDACENGEPTGGGGTPADDDNDEMSFWDTCEVDWANPTNSFECALLAVCQAGNEPGGFVDQMQGLNQVKQAANNQYNQNMSQVQVAYIAALNAAQTARALANTQTRKEVESRINWRTGVGAVLIVAGAWEITAAAVTAEILDVAGVAVGALTETGGIVLFGADVLADFGAIDAAVAGANANFQASVAGPAAAFNAANAINLPPLQSTCAQVEVERQQAMQDMEMRMMELFDACVDSLENLTP